MQQTLESLVGEGHAVRIADMDDADALPPLLQALTAEIGPLSGIVHSAGVLRSTPLRVAKANDFLSQYRTNTVSAALLLSAASRRGVASPQGCSVVLVGSVDEHVGGRGAGGVLRVESGLGRPGANRGLGTGRNADSSQRGTPRHGRDQDVCRTTGPHWPKIRFAPFEQMHPLGLGQPADVAGAIAFLLTDASRWITGSCLTVDGGYSAH